MSISVLCPTRGRPRSVARLLASIRRTEVGVTEAVFYLDDDDPTREEAERVIRADPCAAAVIGPRITLSACWNRCYDEARGPIFMQCGDDLRFRTPGWDARVERAFLADHFVLVHGDDGFQGAQLATHGFLHRDWVTAVGEFVPGIFASDYADRWLTDVADALGRRRYLPEVLTEHLHPAAGKGMWDQTHRERLERHAALGVDALYRQTATQRSEWVTKLRLAVEAAAPVGAGWPA